MFESLSEKVEAELSADEKSFLKANKCAFNFLVQSCTGDAFPYVESGRKNAFVAWKCLHRRYLPNEEEDVVAILTEWTGSTLKNVTGDPTTWFNDLEFVRQRLARAGTEYTKTDAEMKAKIIASLPEAQYSEWKTNVETNIKSISLGELKAHATKYWKRKYKTVSEDHGMDAAELALMASTDENEWNTGTTVTCSNCGKHGHRAVDCHVQTSTDGSGEFNYQGGNGAQKMHMANKRCYRCGTMGHIAAYCPEKNQDEGMFVGMTIESGSDEVFETGGAKQHRMNPELEYWLADTGSSCHVTADGRGLTNFESAYHPGIKVGNGTEALVYGKGSVELIDAKSGKQIRLTDVLYAPAFKKNIISVQKLMADRDVEFIGDQNTFKLVRMDGKDDRIDFERHGLLFYFVGHRVRSYGQQVLESTTAQVMKFIDEMPKLETGRTPRQKALAVKAKAGRMDASERSAVTYGITTQNKRATTTRLERELKKLHTSYNASYRNLAVSTMSGNGNIKYAREDVGKDS
jgi:hypothetical protein